MKLAIVAALLIANTVLWWRLRTDDSSLKAYVRTSPKAFLWRKAFGEERAAEIIRTWLVPLGMAVWAAVMTLIAAKLL